MGPICLGNISKDWSADNMKRIWFTGYVYDFSVDYDPTAVDDIKDIHKYLMKKNNIVWLSTCLKDTSRKATHKAMFLKKVFYIGSLFLSSLESTTLLSCVKN